MRAVDPIDPNREPSADMRAVAKSLREIYVALVREGFTDQQAMAIIGQVLVAQLGGK